MGRSTATETLSVVRASSLVCVGLAALCLLGGAVLGNPAAGGVVGIGLILGAVNPLATHLLLRLGFPAGSTNMTRLGVFTAVVVAAGFAVGLSRAWLLIIGVAAAQMVTAVTASVEMARR
jgi:hypothetical protein